MKRWYLLALCGLFGSPPAPAAEPDSAGVAFFESKIRPVLSEHCYKCHAADTKQRGGLRLDTRDALLKGGDTGAAVLPGKADQSLLVRALRHQDLKMPPKDKLPDVVVADFVRWINLGAPDPRAGKTVVVKEIDWTAARRFWAFQPPQKSPLPTLKNSAWPKNALDHFVLARLEAAGIQPVGPVGKRELIRRAAFDLTGLPPTPQEVESFVGDDSPGAYAALLDRYLASPHYGERWGRYWLDVARYAEDQAHTFAVQPNTNAYRYRDWVVSAFNDDMPYDRFIKLQIAADVLLTDETERLKHLPALGFFGLGAQYYKNTDAAKAAADELDDRVDTLTRGFLGLTVSCARCHDHKFDPIPTQDYYSLAGVFQSCKLANLPLASKAEAERGQQQQKQLKVLDEQVKAFVRRERLLLSEARASDLGRYVEAVWAFQARRQGNPKWSSDEQARRDKLSPALLTRLVKYLEDKPRAPGLTSEAFQKEVQRLLAERGHKPLEKDKTALLQALFGDKGVFTPSEGEVPGQLSSEKKKALEQLQAELKTLQKQTAALPVTHGVAETTPTNMKVFLRGNPATQGDLAPRRFLRILAGDQPTPFTKGSGRLELAEAIASRDNPLTARVMVNRLWQHHFGRGLVGTPSSFGTLGERPTHPELLDYLACRLLEQGWSLKALHKEIMLSAVYQLSSERDDRAFSVDGDNRLLWQMTRRRLDVEAWRDAMLAVSGSLDRTLGGPSLDLAGSENRRRTLYGKVSRHNLNSLLRLFDFPDANITSDKRSETTVPQQQLFVLNSAFVVEQARTLASRVTADTRTEDERVQKAFRLVYGRSASAEEVALARRFLAAEDTTEERSRNRLTRWERLAQVLLGSNEFIYID